MALLSANIVVSESLLWEDSLQLGTLVRVITAINVGASSKSVRFWVLTSLSSEPGGLEEEHILTIAVADRNGKTIAHTEPTTFHYGAKLDPNGPGGFMLRTEIILDLEPIELPIHLQVAAFLDLEKSPVCRTPLMLRRVNA
jgi:hypothetical protein